MSGSDDPASASRTGPLAGTRILELGGGQPGAYACWLLAELGADVVVLALGEEHQHPTTAKPAGPGADDVALHAGKRRLLLDASRAEAREVARRLAERSDAIVSSVPERVAHAVGLGSATVRAAHPRLVYAQASAEGRIGGDPDAQMADIVAQAAGGLMWKTGVEGGPPTAAGTALGEHGAGAYLSTAVLGGLAQAALTGRGTHVDVSLEGAQIALQSWEIGAQSVLGRDSGRAGLGHPEVSPSAIWGAFEAADGWLVLGSVDAARFQRLCALMELPELHARHADDAHRAAGIPEITRELSARFREHGRDHWLDLFAEHDVMGAHVEEYGGVLADEQAWANGYLRRFRHPMLGPVTVAGSPIQFGGGASASGPAGGAWEDATAPLLAELGYDREAIAALRAAIVA
jgi:CoA:oxalate CoA-transferase